MRVAPPLVLCLSLLACQKAPAPAGEPKGPPPPDDVIAVASVRSLDEAAARYQQFLEAVQPGAGAALTAKAAAAGLAGAVGASSIDGIALDKPMHVIVLDPKKHPRPVLLLGHGNAAAMKAGGAVAVEGKDGAALVGEKAGVELCAAWALGSLFREEVPASPTVRASLRKLAALYQPEIEQVKQSMGQVMTGGGSAGMAKVLQLEIDLLLRLAAQTEEMRLVVDASATEASLELRFTPAPGSAFEAFDKAQRPATEALFTHLTRLPSTPGSTMLFIGDYELGPLRGVVFDLIGGAVASWAGTTPDAAFRRRWDDLLGHFKGPIAMASSQSAGPGTSMQQVMEVDDAPKTVAAIKALLPWNRPYTVDVFGMMKMQVTPQEAVATHDGVAIDALTIAFDMAGADPMTQQILRRQWGDGMQLVMAGFDGRLAMVMGKDALADMKATIDIARRRAPAVDLPGGAKLALGPATQRKASYIFFMNMAASMAAMTGRPTTADSGVTMELGFAGGNASVRFGVPAAHIRELKGAMPF
ncbi:MAG TPA: hypothetical protein VKB80_34460 [Kofleriaceae bacterium]|nr:hypothetical protein [Kofleriaceae bacterium]